VLPRGPRPVAPESDAGGELRAEDRPIGSTSCRRRLTKTFRAAARRTTRRS